MQKAYASLRKKKIYLQSQSSVAKNAWLLDGTVYVFDYNKPENLGETIITALQASREGVLPPPRNDLDWRKLWEPTLKAAGLKTVTWKSFAKDATSVWIEYENGVVKFIPLARDENKNGLVHPELVFSCPLIAAELGPALLKAFKLCED